MFQSAYEVIQCVTLLVLHIYRHFTCKLDRPEASVNFAGY